MGYQSVKNKMEKKKIQKDEFEFLIRLVGKEKESYKKQMDWYKKYEPHRKETIKDNFDYIQRLILLEQKLNSEDEVKTCATKHVIPPKSKDSGILPNFT